MMIVGSPGRSARQFRRCPRSTWRWRVASCDGPVARGSFSQPARSVVTTPRAPERPAT
jgi:hypothetical protein